LPIRDDVRHDGCRLVAPKSACPAEASLHLVEDYDAARLPNDHCCLLHEAGRDPRQALIGEDRAQQHAGQRHALRGEIVDRRAHLAERPLAHLGLRQAGLLRPIEVGKPERADVCSSTQRRAGQHADEVAMAVIRAVGTDEAAAAGGDPRHLHCDLVRFGAGAREHDAVDTVGVDAEQALGVVEDRLIQVAAVGHVRRRLSRECIDDARVAVPDDRDVVVHVDVPAAVGVEQPGAFPAHEVQRPLVEQLGVPSQQLVAARDDRVDAHASSPMNRWLSAVWTLATAVTVSRSPLALTASARSAHTSSQAATRYRATSWIASICTAATSRTAVTLRGPSARSNWPAAMSISVIPRMVARFGLARNGTA